jgi:mannose-1-phosphate guanylyltransferase
MRPRCATRALSTRASVGDLQALILVGGEGTRLRPLTSTIPKPVVPLVDRPFISYMLEWLRGHGVDDVILSCGFMADGVRRVLGEGDALELRLRYLAEPEPLGTGGALRFAQELLEDRFFMLNGDVLTDIDLTAQLHTHEQTGASATLALVGVDDPSAYGLVRRNDDGSVKQFVEKPGPEQIDTNLVNAGAYILERAVLDGMAPAGTRISIEREVFPGLVGHGLFGFESDGYWLDIGTPERYLQATFDVLEGAVRTEAGTALRAAGLTSVAGATIEGQVLAPALVGTGSVIARHATVGGRVVLGKGVTVGEGARVESSVVLDGASIGAHATVHSAIVGPDVSIGEHCHIEQGVVLGAGVKLGPDNTLRAGARIFPGVELPQGAIQF